ncbi:MAG: carboxypeptidase-like regulatory domain-containing protein [Chloroflexi bacterium]|nr:carboxypeptidase-like regulatory domain-containing protein [Chloroflexota bacterium]MCL5075333.1 carboxypeptidase-like regulatory domain-containing protein [Chloroflexota bacterium]
MKRGYYVCFLMMIIALVGASRIGAVLAAENTTGNTVVALPMPFAQPSPTITPATTMVTATPSPPALSSTVYFVPRYLLNAPLTPSAEGRGATIRGRVLDRVGAGLAGIVIKLWGHNYKTLTISASDGGFAFVGLPLGSYSLAVEGFSGVPAENIFVDGRTGAVIEFVETTLLMTPTPGATPTMTVTVSPTPTPPSPTPTPFKTPVIRGTVTAGSPSPSVAEITPEPDTRRPSSEIFTLWPSWLRFDLWVESLWPAFFFGVAGAALVFCAGLIAAIWRR